MQLLGTVGWLQLLGTVGWQPAQAQTWIARSATLETQLRLYSRLVRAAWKHACRMVGATCVPEMMGQSPECQAKPVEVAAAEPALLLPPGDLSVTARPCQAAAVLCRVRTVWPPCWLKQRHFCERPRRLLLRFSETLPWIRTASWAMGALHCARLADSTRKTWTPCCGRRWRAWARRGRRLPLVLRSAAVVALPARPPAALLMKMPLPWR